MKVWTSRGLSLETAQTVQLVPLRFCAVPFRNLLKRKTLLKRQTEALGGTRKRSVLSWKMRLSGKTRNVETNYANDNAADLLSVLANLSRPPPITLSST